MATLTLFKSHAPSMGYVFRSGRTVHFAGGMFTTTNQAEIDELNEVCQDSPCFYVDDGQRTVDSEDVSPIALLRKQIREEEIAKLIATTNPNRDLGETLQPQGKLQGIANTAGVTAFTVESGTDQPVAPVLSEIKVGPLTKSK